MASFSRIGLIYSDSIDPQDAGVLGKTDMVQKSVAIRMDVYPAPAAICVYGMENWIFPPMCKR
jgi:hypothetical protein